MHGAIAETRSERFAARVVSLTATVASEPMFAQQPSTTEDLTMTNFQLRATNRTQNSGPCRGSSDERRAHGLTSRSSTRNSHGAGRGAHGCATVEKSGPTWGALALVFVALSSMSGCIIDEPDDGYVDGDELSRDALNLYADSGTEIAPQREPEPPCTMSGKCGGCVQGCLDQLALDSKGCGGDASCESKALQKYTACAQACSEDYPDPGSPGFGGAK